MRRLIPVLMLCLLLCGCADWADGSYYSIERHQEQPKKPEQTIVSVRNYAELLDAMSAMVEQGAESGLLSVEEYTPGQLAGGISRAVNHVTRTHPIGAYAVEKVEYEQGTTSGVNALAVTIHYTRSIEEIRAIKSAADMDEARGLVGDALADCESVLVMEIDQFQNVDFSQIVEDFAEQNPSLVMEIPVVTATFYPESGSSRVVDLRFSYQTNRESLKTMQNYVGPIFDSAALYVSSEEESAALKYWRLHSFLMERSQYKLETSITPTYSLLRHGVGDSKAFAVVYSAMCRRAGLECMVVSGTCQGEARFWNIICDEGVYYHVDLLSGGTFAWLSDGEMTGYVWDYSAYPVCGVPEQVPPETTGQ